MRRPIANAKTIEEVRKFWDRNPLFMGESSFETDAPEFFDEQRRMVVDSCYGGHLNELLFPKSREQDPVLDLGCGIGFWLAEFHERRFANVTGADISAESLKIAARRCALLGFDWNLVEENAEALSFPDRAFEHVNCQGVIHHTPHPDRVLAEISRVLAPGGTVSISVYYKNFILRNWSIFRFVARIGHAFRIGLPGRGRENLLACDDIGELVRQYDGADNPIGVAYDRSEITALVSQYFSVDTVFFGYFPSRAMPFPVPTPLLRLLSRFLPFMIFVNMTKRR